MSSIKKFWIIKQTILRAALVCFAGAMSLAQAQQQRETAKPRTKLIVLGVVDHSGQLVSPMNSPGMLAAFIDKVHPDAICIERPPEEASRNDYYEFTYEVQGVILPYAAQHHNQICPVDWMPPVEDQKLVFGRDLDVPPEIRPRQGSSAFVSFPDPKSLKTDLFAADDPATTAPITNWAAKTPARADQDFPRRLYLYRTYLQSERIRAAAKLHPGGTVLVVIGAFHKPDLEAILAHDPEIELITPGRLGHPSEEEADTIMTGAQRVAILSFNLLGTQAQTKNVDWAWMQHVLSQLAKSGCEAECRLLEIRLDELTGKTSPDSAAQRYRQLIEKTSQSEPFTWTGVKDTERVDSYFDPFGNLTVRQRARVELARILHVNGADADAIAALDEVKKEIGSRKARQLTAYASIYLGLSDQRR